VTGTTLQDTFKIEAGYLDHIIESVGASQQLEAKTEDETKKKLTVAVFCSKVGCW